MSFWDSSAIVPLCINENRSQRARTIWRNFPSHFVWLETPVEIMSAIARREREGAISEADRIKGESRLTLIETSWSVVDPEKRSIELARSFPVKYGLKALDSLQLAAALVWCKELPTAKDFVSSDERLLKAAEKAGFSVHFL